MFCSAGFGTKLLLLLAFISTISAAYTTYVEDYHTSTGTLYGFSAMPRGRAGSSDFPARPETQEALASALESTNPMRTDDATARRIWGLLRESHTNSRYLLQTALHPDNVGSMSDHEKAWLSYYGDVYARIRNAFQDNRAFRSILYNAAQNRGPVDRSLAYVKTTGTTISRAVAHLG